MATRMATTASLFCGAGGESLGQHLAFRELGIPTYEMIHHALNHWDLAVAAHHSNLPWIHVHQESITAVTAETYGLGHITLLHASPSCTHHSRARGGKPCEEQQRSHAWEVIDRWLDVAVVDVFTLENVEEWLDWGPLYTSHSSGCTGDGTCLKGCHHGKPIPEMKGFFFVSFLLALQERGYQVEWKILNAADFGDPTTRKRLFMQAVRDGRGIVWPRPTHRNPKAKPGVYDPSLPPWRAAAECIDWSDLGQSIFERKRELAPATLRRIAAGIVKYVLRGKPFVINTAYSGTTGRGSYVYSTDDALPTLTGRAGLGVVSPFISKLSHGTEHGVGNQPPDEPLRTQTAQQDKAVVTPILINYRGTDDRRLDLSAARADEPMKTVTGGIHEALVTPFLASLRGTAPDQIPNTAASAEEPLRTVAASGNHAALIAPYLAAYHGRHKDDTVERARGSEVLEPIPTLDTANRYGLVAASLVQTGYGERNGQDPRCLDIEAPLGTVVAGGVKHALTAALLTTIDQQSTGESATRPAEAPLSTMTTKARHAIVAASLMANNTNNAPHHPEEPLGTVTTGDRHYVVASFLERNFGGGENGTAAPAVSVEAPMPTVTAHDHSSLVAAFLTHYYSSGGQSQAADDPMHTITTLARHGLVTVTIDGETYVITDIRMRMLEPPELARAMGFPDWYRWTDAKGKPFTKRDTVKMIGNACPVNTVKALVRKVVLARPEAFGLFVPPPFVQEVA